MKTRKRTAADLATPAKALESTPEELEALLPTSIVLLCPSGATIVREGTPGGDVYVILKGNASVRESQWVFLSKQVAKLKPGDLFGEIGFLAASTRTASVVADGPCEVLRIVAHEFSGLLEKKPELRARLEEQARQRIYALSNAVHSPS